MAPVHARAASLVLVLQLASAAGCGDEDGAPPTPPLALTAVTFNSGTSERMGHDQPPDDGYTSAHAATSDEWYGDGLAWLPAVEATRRLFAEVQPDVVAFQEVFDPEECAGIPVEGHADFACETWTAGDPSVAHLVLGAGYQVGCHPGKTDKCLAVRRAFASLSGCADDTCPDALIGSRVEDCGSGARVARAVLDLAQGGRLTVVSVHGSSGIATDDQACRAHQVDQVFIDVGDGAPAANGERNLILGDFNTDPVRFSGFDPSAARWLEFTGPERSFSFVTDVGPDAPATYTGVNIDHVVSDSLSGDCWAAGVTPGHPRVIDAVYFDHTPIVCALQEAPAE